MMRIFSKSRSVTPPTSAQQQLLTAEPRAAEERQKADDGCSKGIDIVPTEQKAGWTSFIKVRFRSGSVVIKALMICTCCVLFLRLRLCLSASSRLSIFAASLSFARSASPRPAVPRLNDRRPLINDRPTLHPLPDIPHRIPRLLGRTTRAFRRYCEWTNRAGSDGEGVEVVYLYVEGTVYGEFEGFRAGDTVG
jgi:hypothetical protein